MEVGEKQSAIKSQGRQGRQGSQGRQQGRQQGSQGRQQGRQQGRHDTKSYDDKCVYPDVLNKHRLTPRHQI